MSDTLLYSEESFAIRGAVMEVYSQMGTGFLETVYQSCLEIEFQQRSIPFISQPTLHVHYKQATLEKVFVPDFVCYDKIILEIKAVQNILPEHKAQAFNYLKASRMRLALLVNFCHYPKAEIERIVL